MVSAPAEPIFATVMGLAIGVWISPAAMALIRPLAPHSQAPAQADEPRLRRTISCCSRTGPESAHRRNIDDHTTFVLRLHDTIRRLGTMKRSEQIQLDHFFMKPWAGFSSPCEGASPRIVHKNIKTTILSQDLRITPSTAPASRRSADKKWAPLNRLRAVAEPATPDIRLAAFGL